MSLEGLTSALGETLSELGGLRSTRTTAVVSPGSFVQRGYDDASSADAGATITFTAPVPNTGGIVIGDRFRLVTDAGTSITSGVGTAQATSATRLVLTSGTFAAAVLPGRRFEVGSGPYAGLSATINRRISDTELELAEPGFPGPFVGADWEVFFDLTLREAVITAIGVSGSDITDLTFDRLLGRNCTNESWEVIRAAETSVPVETTLDWADAGQAYIGGEALRYSEKTTTSLDAVRPRLHQGRQGYIRVPAGVAITDGENFDIDDGDGTVRTFQFVKPLSTVADLNYVQVGITDAMTAAQVASALATAITDFGAFNVLGFVDATTETDVVELWNTVPGGESFIDTYSRVTAVGFELDGPRGVAASIRELQDVVDGNEDFSGVDTTKSSFFVERATGADLDLIGLMLGVPRPPELATNDDTYRRLIKAAAYGPSGTIYGLELILDAVLGNGNWEIYEDLELGSIIHTCTVYFWRKHQWYLLPNGKTFLHGVEHAPRGGSSTTLSISQAPTTVINVRYADDPGPRRYDGVAPNRNDLQYDHFGRMVCYGRLNAASSDGGITVTATELSNAVLAGDLFIIESGPFAGRMGTVAAGGVGTVTLVDDAPVYGEGIRRIGTNFSNASWRVVRPMTNCRHYRPSDDTSVEYGAGSLVPMWSFNGGGAANEGADTSHVSAAPGPYFRIVNGGVGDTISYEHEARILPSSYAQMSMYAKFEGTITTNGTECIQGHMTIRDGGKEIAIGVFEDAGDIVVGLIDTSTGAHLSANVFVQTDFTDYEIRKYGTDTVEFWADGRLVDRQDYSAFPINGNTMLRFGVDLATSANAELWVKHVHWHITTPDNFWNTTDSGSTAAANPTRLTSGASVFLAGDVGKNVKFTEVTATNAAGGDARAEDWIVDAYNAASNVELIGPRRTGLTVSELHADRVYLPADSAIFPRWLGHQLVIASGPNAGTYTIDDVLDDVDEGSLSTKFATSLADDPLTVPSTHSAIVQISPDLPDNDYDGKADWYLVPVLPTDANVEFELANTGTNVSTALTLRTALHASITAGKLLEVEYTSEESAIVHDDEALVVQSYVDGTFPDDVRANVSGATVTFPAGTLASTLIHERMWFRPLHSTTHLPMTRVRIASIDTVNDELTLENDKLGTMTQIKWDVVAGPDNVEFTNGRHLLLPFYLADDWSWLAEFLSTRLAAGVIGDFESMFREDDDSGIDGVKIME